MLPEEPVVSLASGKPRAVYPGLLSGSDAYHLSSDRVSHGIRLSILQCDQRDKQIPHSTLREILILSRDVPEAVRGEFQIVVPLLEVESEDLLRLYRIRLIIRIHLNDEITALPLLLEDLKGFRTV